MLTFYAKGKDDRIEAIKRNFVPVALDGYLRGNGAELEFLKTFRVQGNGFTYLTAGGRVLGRDSYRSLADRGASRLTKVLEEFDKLPEAERKPRIDQPEALGSRDRVPLSPPPGALISNVFFTYLERDGKDGWRKALWHVEGQPGTEPGSGHGRNQYITHVDKLWLTEAEWKSLVPAKAEPGTTFPVPAPIHRRLVRFYASDIAHRATRDRFRSAELTLTVENVSEDGVSLRLDGFTQTGCTFEEARLDGKDAHARGLCGADYRWLGFLNYDAKKKRFYRFEIVAFGDGWGGGRRQAATTNFYRGGDHRRWPMGIAFELMKGNRPVDRLPPQNANKYRTGNDYFSSGK